MTLATTLAIFLPLGGGDGGFSHWLLYIGFPLLLGLYAQWKVTSTIRKYSQVPTAGNITGAEIAQRILDAAQIRDVQVEEINGMLGDHYDPTSKRLCLSSDVYHSASVAAVGIAAHETGHAIQHAKAYAPLAARMAVVPITQFASQILPFVMIGGFWFGFFALIKLGIICYLVLTFFQLVTLPVEIDASKRAKIILEQMGFIREGEITGVNRVLDSAALTYVAAFIASLGNLLYLLSLTNQRRN
ncbi:MAG: zinc metallopeptidase [Chthoniobacteraceae bacterium]